jgi:FtsZ-interacting cell division protein YlmF
MSCSHSTVSAYLNGRRVPPPDQLKTFVLACKGDPATWQERLETVHETLSRLPAPDVPRTVVYDQYADAKLREQDWSSQRQRSPEPDQALSEGPDEQVPSEGLSRTSFDPTGSITSGMGSDEAQARLRQAFREADHQVKTLHPRTYNEARTIGEHVREGTAVIMNLDEMVDRDATRLVDFAAGLIFGLRGSIDRVANKVLLLSPANVEASAEDDSRSVSQTGQDGASHLIMVLRPRTYNETRTVGEYFREGTAVIMGLTEMVDSDAKRFVDFAAGLIFGLRGSLERVTNRVFLLAPASMEVTAEDKARIAERGFFNQS